MCVKVSLVGGMGHYTWTSLAISPLHNNIFPQFLYMRCEVCLHWSRCAVSSSQMPVIAFDVCLRSTYTFAGNIQQTHVLLYMTTNDAAISVVGEPLRPHWTTTLLSRRKSCCLVVFTSPSSQGFFQRLNKEQGHFMIREPQAGTPLQH